MTPRKRGSVGAFRPTGDGRAAGIRRPRRAGTLPTGGLILLTLVGSVAAQGRSEELTPSDGRVIRADRAVATVLVADPEVADVQLVSDRTLFLYGKAIGRTRLLLLDADEAVVEDIEVVVADPRPTVLTGR